MTLKRLACLAAILALGTAASAAQEVDQTRLKELAVQCARAKLKLAEMNLARAQELNSKVPGTLISGMMDQFKKEVQQARVDLKIAQDATANDTFQTSIEHVRLALEAAKERAKIGLQTHKKAPTVVTKGDVERMRLFAVIIELQLQRGEALRSAPTEQKLDWVLEVLNDDLQRVRIYTYLLGQNRIGQFFPGGL